MALAPEILAQLRCPVSGRPLVEEDGALVADDGGERYRINAAGVPLFATTGLTADAATQQAHYDTIAGAYIENLSYPHTQVYTAYLDSALDEALAGQKLGVMAEICCGRGEAIHQLAGRYDRAIGVDISEAMLNAAVAQARNLDAAFVQGNATNLPLADASVDSVVMLGGIHHVMDRRGLFSEVRRILRPGGRFTWREPVDDLFLWRWIRAVIYRVSPLLDAATEAPLRRASTEADMAAAGLRLERWNTYGFFGFCLFMNSDVLVFNRLFRYLPGIREITRAAIACDDFVTRRPALAHAGLQAVGVAWKPGSPADDPRGPWASDRILMRG